ncbi:P-loop containing nucleoside triphosphate hydrolase protein [Apiospora kogelbergensis]|uniref:P-loop containing nucleoside triphosphate hydrolase protein n=1 Tax=Apiospora kogelbergensis TaxID=1337665 RepID=A0AAW0QPY7_9PEZI
MENITSSLPPLEEATPMGIFQALLGQWAGKLDITQTSSLLTLTAFAFGSLRWLRGSTSSVVDSLRDYATIRVVIPSSNEMSTFVSEWVDRTVLPRRYNQSYVFREAVDDEEDEDGNRISPIVPIISEEDEEDEDEDEESAAAAGGGALVKKGAQQADRPIECVPQFNRTWFFYQGRFFTIRRGKGSSNDDDDSDDDDDGDSSGVFTKQHTITITCVSHSSKPVVDFLEMCRQEAKIGLKKKPQMRIHGHDGYRYWRFKSKSPARPLSSIHLDSAVKKDLLSDIEKYLSPATRRRYQQRNIPYQRGYLLHGPPGTGKSTLASVLAGRYGLSLYVLQLVHIDDEDLERLFQDLPSRCIVLMEDIDAAGIDQKKKSDGKKDAKSKRKESECTLSGILNVLDGVGAQEGRIVIMTTNFPDELDEALVRPGRIDKKVYIGYISRKSAEEMFVRMFRPIKNDKKKTNNKPNTLKSSNKAVKDGYKRLLDEKTEDSDSEEQNEVCRCEKCKATSVKELAAEFAQLVPENNITPSELQGFFQVHLDCPVEAVDKFTGWLWQMREEKAPRRRKNKHGVISLPNSPTSEKTDESEQTASTE